MRLVAQALAGPALKGGELGEVASGSELAALTKLTANWRSVVEDVDLTRVELQARRAGQSRIQFDKRRPPMSNVQAADWSRRVREVEQLVAGSHHKQALQEAGSLLESLLKELYRRTIDHVSPSGAKTNYR